MAGGRPPIRYDAERHPEFVRALAIEGLTNEEIASRLGMSNTTLKEWRKKYPQFSTALKEGKEEADAKVEMSLYNRALGYEVTEEKALNIGGELCIAKVKTHIHPDPTSCIFWLKNRRPDKWRDKIQQEVSGPDGGPVEHIVRMTDDELEHRAKQILNRRTGDTN